MAKLIELLDALHESLKTSSAEEIKAACELIVDVQNMRGSERDCIIASYTAGPIFDGDVPCKESRDKLNESGYMTRVVVRGEDGFNACTNKGAWAYRLIVAGC